MYAVLIEFDPETGSYGATAPDFGIHVIGIGKSADEALWRFKRALGSYVRVMHEDGKPLPEPRHAVATVELEALVWVSSLQG